MTKKELMTKWCPMQSRIPPPDLTARSDEFCIGSACAWYREGVKYDDEFVGHTVEYPKHAYCGKVGP